MILILLIIQLSRTVDLHLSKPLFSLDPDNQQLHCFLELRTLLRCSFFWSLDQHCKTFRQLNGASRSITEQRSRKQRISFPTKNTFPGVHAGKRPFLSIKKGKKRLIILHAEGSKICFLRIFHSSAERRCKVHFINYYIDTDEIPGFFLLLKNHIFISRSEDIIFIFHVWGYWCRHGY